MYKCWESKLINARTIFLSALYVVNPIPVINTPSIGYMQSKLNHSDSLVMKRILHFLSISQDQRNFQNWNTAQQWCRHYYAFTLWSTLGNRDQLALLSHFPTPPQTLSIYVHFYLLACHRYTFTQALRTALPSAIPHLISLRSLETFYKSPISFPMLRHSISFPISLILTWSLMIILLFPSQPCPFNTTPAFPTSSPSLCNL